MPVTIQTNGRGWFESGTTIFWSAHVVWSTGTALYAVVQDSGATPKVRVFKGNSYPNPTSWAEQDSANNKTVSNVNYSFNSHLAANGDLHIIYYSATNTVVNFPFSTSTDTWGTTLGNITTTAQNERPIRNVKITGATTTGRRAAWTDSTDDADLGWLTNTSGSIMLLATSTEASTMAEMVRDSTDRTFFFYYDCAGDDFLYRSINSAGTAAAVATIDAATVQGSEAGHSAGGRFNVFDDAGTDKVYAAYLSSTGTLSIRESLITLESDSAGGNVAATAQVHGTNTNVGTRTPLSTAVVGGVPYCAWWDDASSGTLYYSTKSGGAWAAPTAFATGITRLVEIVPVSTDGLMVVYQSGTSVVMDWILTPSAGGTPATLTVTTATATAQAETITFDAASKMTATTATATAAAGASALTGQARLPVTVATATAQDEAVAFTAATKLTSTTATATAQAEAVNLAAAQSATLTASTATATGQAESATLAGQARLALTIATSAAQAEAITLDAASLFVITPATATAQGEAVTLDAASKLTATTAAATAEAGTVVIDADVAASLTASTATATAQAGTVNLAAATAATLSAGTATSMAQAEAITFDGAGRMILDTADATAQAGDVIFSAGGVAVLSASTATATAQAEDVALDADVAAMMTVTSATATAAAGGATFDVAATLSSGTATATAQAEGVTFTAAAGAVMAIDTAAATARAEVATFDAAGRLVIDMATASAEAESVTLAGSVAFTVTAATATAQDGAVDLVSGDVIDPSIFLVGHRPVLVIDAPRSSTTLTGLRPAASIDGNRVTVTFSGHRPTDLEE